MRRRQLSFCVTIIIILFNRLIISCIATRDFEKESEKQVYRLLTFQTPSTKEFKKRIDTAFDEYLAYEHGTYEQAKVFSHAQRRTSA